ncbi:MAG: glycosyltransferase family 2 protein [Nitrospiraceae bacterium]|nr:glycosyltransferase family 2 protein [Nitrospiraceae bacterium]
MNAERNSVTNSPSGYWVVIPAYNEAATIRDVASGALRQMSNVIVVNDGSTDGTEQALAGLAVIVLKNPTNGGKAASLWLGFQYGLERGAMGVITLDGDGQHAPEDISKLVAEARRFPDHLIIGARRRDQRRAAFWRYGANCIADFWISWAAGAPFEDSQSGFRVYPESLLRRVKSQHGKARSFVFESEVLIEATHLGYRSTAISIDAWHRPGARPSYFRPTLDIVRITLMIAWKLLSRGMHPAGLYRTLTDRSPRLDMRNECEQSPSRVRLKPPLL